MVVFIDGVRLEVVVLANFARRQLLKRRLNFRWLLGRHCFFLTARLDILDYFLILPKKKSRFVTISGVRFFQWQNLLGHQKTISYE